MNLPLLLLVLAAQQHPFETASRVDAQNDFQLSGEMKFKQFLLNDEPDLILRDYSNYQSTADQEIGVHAHFMLWNFLRLAAYPYIWRNNHDSLARVGLDGNISFNTRIRSTILTFGYGHHSWHNVDNETPPPDSEGRMQDWLFANQFAIISLPEVYGQTNWNMWFLYWQYRFYFHNNNPAAIKIVYENEEPEANYELSANLEYYSSSYILRGRPYVQFANGHNRYGLKAEAYYPLNQQVMAFTDAHYYLWNDNDRWMVSAGMLLKFQ